MSERWTAETEELVARACGDPGSVCSRKADDSTAQWSAHAVLTLLDANGLLLPPGGEAREEVEASPEVEEALSGAIDLMAALRASVERAKAARAPSVNDGGGGS